MPKYAVTDQSTGKKYVLEGESPPTEQELAEIFSAKKGIVERVMGAASPPTDDYPELPYIYQGDPQKALELYKQVDPSATIGSDSYGNVVFTGDKGTYYQDKPGLTFRDVPQFFSDATDFLQVAAPSIAGGTVAAPMRAIPAIATMAGVGGISEGVREGANALSEGREYDVSKPIAGAAYDALGEGGGRLLFRVLRPIAVKLFGKAGAQKQLLNEDGTLTDDAIAILKKAKDGELIEDELAKMTRQGALTAEEAERFNLFVKHGLDPTKAQVTRKATDFQNQQELAKRTGRVRQALEVQDSQIRQNMDNAVPRQEGDAYWFVRDRVEAADKAIGNLYQQARGSLPEGKNIRLDDLFRVINDTASQNQASNGLISALRGELRRMGVIGKKGVQGRIDFQQAEDVRKFINSFYDSTTPQGRRLIKQYKDALDDDVFRVAGLDYFSAARRAKSSLEESLERASLGSRDKRAAKGILLDVVENRVSPEDFLPKLRSRATRADDVLGYKEFLLSQGDEGVKAWNSLRSSVMDDIIESTFRGASGEGGIPSPSRSGMEKALKDWSPKLPHILDAGEREFLADVMKLLKFREPIPGTALGKGPSAQGIAYAADRIVRKIPFVGDMAIDLLKKVASEASDARLLREVLDTGAADTAKALSKQQMDIIAKELQRLATPVGGAVAGSAIASD